MGWPFPGLVWGPYPQARLPAAPPDRKPGLGRGALARLSADLHARLQQPLAVDAALQALRGVPEARRDDRWLEEALQAAATAMEQVLRVRPHRQQLMAARALLDQRLVEMDTGEGKTLAIAMAAAVAALARTPVHVVTANDYLAQRDAESLRPFFARLGLSVDFIAQPREMAERRIAYGCDVTYCTAKELAFDYLRDSLLHPADQSALERRLRDAAPGRGPVLRGLCMAILDEADTILVDEARVPLVLSQPAGGVAEEAFLRRALAIAHTLAEGRDFTRDAAGATVRLTASGVATLSGWEAHEHPLLGHPQHRATTVELALTALHLLQRDRDYVVRDGEVMLVDDTTGRAAAGRAWSRGLHQLVELKERVKLTVRNSTVTQITYQRFFVRYLRLAGISGTLRGAGSELRAVYGLRMVRVPPRTPRRVRHEPARLLADSASLWQAVAQRAGELAQAGRPVLVGCETVRESEALAARMRACGLQPLVLNAREDQEETRIIGEAGTPGRITVATSMAGRGADISMAPEVLHRGGLHVILCQLNPSARIDRQFLGRAGRQGQPGSCQVMLAQDFALLQRWLPKWWQGVVRGLGFPRPLAWAGVTLAQLLEAYARSQQRVTLSRVAEAEERELNFSRWGMG
jgi:preprotein translocase subunit SecA